MICNNCGTENDEGSVFCSECGQRMETVNEQAAPVAKESHTPTVEPSAPVAPAVRQIFCAKCGTAITEGAAFCMKCGAPVVSGSVASQPLAATADDPDPQSGGHKAVGLVALIMTVIAALITVFGDTIIIKPKNVLTQIWGNESSVSLLKLTTDSNKITNSLNNIGLASNEDVNKMSIFIGILIIIACVSVFLLIIAAAEFFTPRKNDSKYLHKVRRGWEALLFPSFVFAVTGVGMIVCVKNDGVLTKIYDFNMMYYVCLTLFIAAVIMSAIMISIYTNLMNTIKRRYLNSPEYKEYTEKVSELRAAALNKTAFDPYHSKNKAIFVLCILSHIVSYAFGFAWMYSGAAMGIAMTSFFFVFTLMLFICYKTYLTADYLAPTFIGRKRSGWICVIIFTIIKCATYTIAYSRLITWGASKTIGFIVELILCVAVIAISIYSISICGKYIKTRNQKPQQ